MKNYLVNINNITWKDIFSNYNLFYFFAIIIYTAQANEFTNVLRGFRGSYIAFFLPVILTIILFVKNKVSLKSSGLVFTSIVYFIWILLIFILKDRFDVTLFFVLYEQIFIAYVIVQVYGLQMFSLFEKIVTKLSVICLIVWASHILMPTLVEQICEPFSVYRDSIVKYNFFFASILNFSRNEELWYRNPGFSWEPGMNACIICTAIFFNLFTNNFKIRGNKNLWILLIALMTSLSTTGYTVFLGCILPFYLLQKRTLNIIISGIFLIPIVAFIVQLDFMSEKLIKLQSSEYTRDQILYNLEWNQQNKGFDVAYVPQRFDGIMFQLLNVQNEPILGYGLNEKDNFLHTKINEAIAPSEGIVKLYARYGLLLGILLTIVFIISCRQIAIEMNYKKWFFLILFYILISMSYPFYDIPLYMAFLYYCLFKKYSYKKKYENV